jgi:hypothetical protein
MAGIQTKLTTEKRSERIAVEQVLAVGLRRRRREFLRQPVVVETSACSSFSPSSSMRGSSAPWRSTSARHVLDERREARDVGHQFSLTYS